MPIISAFNRYDEEAIFFDEAVRNAKRKQLESKALDVRLLPAFYDFILNFYRADMGCCNKLNPP